MRVKKRLPVVCIEFHDHCMDTTSDLKKPIYCQVFGVLYKEDELAYYVASWICDREVESANTEGFCILKSTVIRKHRIG